MNVKKVGILAATLAILPCVLARLCEITGLDRALRARSVCGREVAGPNKRSVRTRSFIFWHNRALFNSGK